MHDLDAGLIWGLIFGCIVTLALCWGFGAFSSPEIEEPSVSYDCNSKITRLYYSCNVSMDYGSLMVYDYNGKELLGRKCDFSLDGGST